MTTLSRIQTIFQEWLSSRPEDIHPDALLIEDIGCDSLDLVELTMAIEEEFQIRITDEEAEACKTVGDLVRLTDSKIVQPAS